jgi:hypothetical protein
MRLCEPIREIELAARTGFLSKKIWNEFFASGKIAWRNRTWKNLVARKYFLPHYATLASDSVIRLNPKHPLVVKMLGDKLPQVPSIAVIEHDETVVETFLLLKNMNILKAAKFETELKREDLRNKRHFDSTDKTKFPDLMIQLNSIQPSGQIAIEIELSRKEPKRYRQMMNSYMCAKDISKIIFVTDLDVVKNNIKTATRDTYFPEWEKPVGFAKLSDWRQNPAAALIEFSEFKTSLVQLQSVA